MKHPDARREPPEEIDDLLVVLKYNVHEGLGVALSDSAEKGRRWGVCPISWIVLVVVLVLVDAITEEIEDEDEGRGRLRRAVECLPYTVLVGGTSSAESPIATPIPPDPSNGRLN